MSAEPVPTWTVICDGCGADAFAETDYCGWGPTEAEARTVAGNSDWTCDDSGDWCWDCAAKRDEETS